MTACPVAAGLGAVLFACAADAVAAPTAVQQYKQAQKAFKEEKFSVAQKVLAGILRKHPDFQPAKMLLGRIYFRAGKMGPAYKYFKAIGSDMITPDVAYEFGITMFSKKNYKRAVVGLARVPASSKYASLAYFYRGISHARLRDWQKAVTYLQRSKNLPPHLEPTRREALSQCRQALRAERFGGQFSQGDSSVILPSTPPPSPPSYVDPVGGQLGEPAAGTGAKKTEKPKAPPAGFTNQVTPSFAFEQKAGTVNYFGLRTAKNESRSTTVKAAYKGKYLAEARPSGGQPSFSLGVEGSEVVTSSKGAETKYIVYTNDPNTILEQEQPVKSDSDNTFILLIQPEASYPVAGKVDVGAGYALQESLPDFKADEKSEKRSPFGSLAYNGDSVDVKATGKMTDAIDKTGVTTSSTTIFGGQLTKAFETTTIDIGGTQTTKVPTVLPAPGLLAVDAFFGVTQAATLAISKTFDTFSLSINGAYTAYVADAGYARAQEDSAVQVGLTMTKSFEFGGQFSVSGSSRQLSQYKVELDKLAETSGAAPGTTPATPPAADPAQPADPNAPPVAPKVIVPADGSQTSATVSFKMAPLEWLYGQAAFAVSRSSFTTTDPKYQNAFEMAVGETTNELTITVGVSKTF